MSTAIDESTDILDKLDFDFEEPCKPIREECDNKAEWLILVTVPCCTQSVFFCDGHKNRMISWFNQSLTENWPVKCIIHDVRFDISEVEIKCEPL